MFKIQSRRYTGAKTKLISQIEKILLKYIDQEKEYTFFDVFGGTGVVSHHFAQQKYIKELIINDFLYSNFIIYQGFFTQEKFNFNKLEQLKKDFNLHENLKPNYYSKHFGSYFFSNNDAIKIGIIREKISFLLKEKYINQKEFYILLSSLIYSLDRIANTVGHYDAYRTNIKPKDCFTFELISPLNLLDVSVQIHNQDSNILTTKICSSLDLIAYVDPPYNSRQYSRFYHLLETIALDEKPELYGKAKKPLPDKNKISHYCKAGAIDIFYQLILNLSCYTKLILVSYNNTQSANPRSNTKITNKEIENILKKFGKTKIYKIPFKAFNSGKTNFKEHYELIYACEIKQS